MGERRVANLNVIYRKELLLSHTMGSKGAHYSLALAHALTAGAWSSPAPAATPRAAPLSWPELVRKWGKHTHGSESLLLFPPPALTPPRHKPHTPPARHLPPLPPPPARPRRRRRPRPACVEGQPGMVVPRASRRGRRGHG